MAQRKISLITSPDTLPMQIGKRSMNWLPRASAYGEMANARAKRQAMNDSYISSATSQASLFSDTLTNFSAGKAELTAKVYAKRVQMEAAAKLSKTA